jgi:hypothetical protein
MQFRSSISSFEMRSKILSVVVGIVVTLAAAEGVARLLDHRLPAGTQWPSVETDVKYHRLSELPEADVVFLGSSITEAAIDPEAFIAESGAHSAFNSGIPFSSPISNEWWLNEVVLKEVDPELVVIGLTAWSGGSGSSGDRLLKGLKEAPRTPDRGWSALLDQAGLLAEWDARSTEDRTRAFLTELGHQTGYYDRSIDDAEPLDLPFGPLEMPRVEADAVGRMIDRLAEDGVEAVVLIEPGRYPGDSGSIDYDRYIDSVLSHESEWGVPVLDTFHMGWERKWFADLAHFNREGTEEFTSYIAGFIDGLWAEDSGQPVENTADIA